MDRAWLLIKALGDRIALFRAVNGQVLALQQVLAAEAVGVVAGSMLPGPVRVAAVDRDHGLDGHFGTAGHFFPLVIGQRLAQRCGDAVELAGIAFEGGEAAVAAPIFANSTQRALRSTRTPTAEWLPALLMKSPSPGSGKARSSTSGGRT